MYAKVLIEHKVKTLDHEFTYQVPEKLISDLKIGMQVIVPFGKQILNGYVLDITDTTDMSDLKSIYRIKDNGFILNEELINIADYLTKTTLCSKVSAIEAMVPSSFKVKSKKNNDKYLTYITLNDSIINIENYIYDNARNKKQISILELLLKENKVLKNTISGTSLNTLLSKGLVKEEKEQVYRNTTHDINYEIKLNEEQKTCFNSVKFNEEKTYLLHGVTGSGKTEVYINLIKKAIKLKKTALLLVPEITLTAQIVKRLYNAFGNDIAVFHSALSDGEKNDEYERIMRGEVNVVVGTRSSCFAPLTNLGIIIVDEEQSDSYKQENNPRYDAINVLKERSRYWTCPLILGSATPTLESYARAKKGNYHLLTLKTRAQKSILPIIHLVNMEEEYQKRNMIISDFLKELINDRLENQEQVILLLNRRGYSTILTCPNCGYTYKCPHCDINLTYHKTNNSLRCHYCGYTVFKKEQCPNCKIAGLNDFGLGTEKLETTIKEMFPNAKVLRMDADTTTKKNSHEKLIEQFSNHEYDILLGTQMISKGLDFPLVTLVGVINADQTLTMPDFKANERTFSLLSQVSGRAGRGNIPGEVVIQTMNPTDYTLNCIKDNNYEMFYRHEMHERMVLKYPPYYYLVTIKVVSRDLELVTKESTKAVKYLKNNLKNVEILGPTTPVMFKMNNLYRMQIIIKYRSVNNLFNILKELDQMYIGNNLVRLEIDTSPRNI